GKSTLLNIIAGLDEPTTGRIILDGRDITGLAPHKRDIAMVFQNYALYPHLSVYENMAFGLRARGVKNEVIKEKVKEASRVLEIEEKLDAFPKQLSGGQRQRVATGRAIVRDPKLFLFDEPLSNLDARLRLEVRKEFLKLQKKLKTTSLYVTHDQAEALALGDIVVVVNDCTIQQVSVPRQLYDKPANLFVAGFIGTPPMNIIECRLISKDNTLCLKRQGLEIRLPESIKEKLQERRGKKIYCGIRPTAIHIADKGYKAELLLLETLGEEQLAYFKLAEGVELRVVLRQDKALDKKDEFFLSFDFQKMHFFDENGTRL
ncbi:ABC transporter ATP-binding protein, partial [Candidatus Omnitrophota bacterium]